MTRKKIKKLIKDITGKDAKVEHPIDPKNGDYSTNVAMVAKLDPNKIAGKLKNEPMFEKVTVVKPGFINFYLSKEYLQKQVGKIKIPNIGKNKKVQVEFISANPTGPLTVGNARGGPFGDVLANILKKAGFKVVKAYYVNDCGMQILTLGHSVLKDKEAKYKGLYIDELNKKIKQKKPYKTGQAAAKIIIEKYIKKTAAKAGIKFDQWYFESEFYKSSEVDKALKFLEKKKLLYEKEDAVWFKSSKFGDKRDRVVVKSDGANTYLAGDIALHRRKFEKEKFDKVINIWGADHAGDVLGLQACVKALGHEGKLDIVLLQFVTLLEEGVKKKMSKRLGTLVTMNELLDLVGPDVVRFFFLQKSANTHLNFDLSLAKKQSDKNPVYYIQYAHARICSILRKAKNLKKSAGAGKFKFLEHPTELKLIKELIKFPEIVEDTARDYQVQRLPQYAMDLATAFHKFYRDCRVLTEDKKTSQARMALLLATKTILKNTLDLMGIKAPERM